ncbi:hypothetical protein ZYGR_0N02980 [Zygosaccharomyces rouxii]|uniref:ZYRO0D07172p n=2 Tax=Zygosaccharomyces rouxii TaxID=4956 RepID=C5DVJ3_ZYGRC|nr:uncharacterized protein ZYRO0D07172g [Zygosaccharomyces rouxii]KAH9200724.1 hypothetical protein LQ764DRAFT_98190 [Zygosaccharomyces rouxii]GAV48893.1 hypothetical protein ZYGR_0N02980 [Zygosaccharomyces rouxii]CAR27812.1 ZYRO0D07172p [Zygosaccharomyces rouxii]
MDENYHDVAIDEDASPAKKFGTEKQKTASDTAPNFSDRVARLSISEDANTSRDIINGLKHSKMTEENRADKRRRRSSAQSLNGPERSATVEGNGGSKQDVSEEKRENNKVIKKAKKEPKKEVKKEVQREAVIDDADMGSQKTSRKKKKKARNAHGIISVEKLGARTSSVSDLREPMISCLYGKTLDASNLKIKNMSSVKKVITVFVPGLQPEDLGLPSGTSFKDAGPFEVKNSKLFTKVPLEQNVEAFPISAPGSKNSLYPAYNHFINRTLSKNERKTRHQELSSQKITINHLLMSLNDLVEHDYPIHPHLLDESARQLNTNAETYVDTQRFDHDGSHIFALDCEMCLSAKGSVLTRVSIVGFDGNVVYDQLVKPDTPITDYLTKYSGITEEKLANVTTTLQDVQRDILNMVSEDDVLIGHSLENDLNALKIRHPKIVDTSVIYDHRAGPPFRPALRHLASTHLNYNIQTGEKIGHNPIEDAKACMDLVKLKIVSGLTFGVSVTTENIFQKLSAAGIKCLKLDDNAFKRRNAEAVNAVSPNYDGQVFESLIDNIDDNQFLVARLKELAQSRGYAYNVSMRSDKEKGEVPSETQSLDVLSRGLANLYEKSPNGTMIAVFSGNGDTRPYSKIMAELETIDRDQRTKARQERSGELEKAVSRARDGVAVIFFKQETLDE